MDILSLKSKYIPDYVGFEVFTVVVLKSIIFWDMMLCSLLSCNRRFGGTYRWLQLRLQDVISQKMIFFTYLIVCIVMKLQV
jgi:hypothetical protein